MLRRRFLLGCMALGSWGAASACSRARRDAAHPAAPPAARLGKNVDLWSWFDLPPEDPRARELSAIVWDGASKSLWAVQDKSPNIIELIPGKEYRSWAFGRTIPIDLGGAPVDFEGLVETPDGFLISSEKGPRIIEVDRSGHYRRDLAVPARFADARTNKSLESLTLSPSGRYLFTTSEAALAHDGPNATVTAGTRVRILRLARDDRAAPDRVVSEHAYETDPIPFEGCDWGISDMCAIGDDELLVLERGWTVGHGNTARIYRVSLDSGSSCLDKSDLWRLPVVAKTLAVDFMKLVAQGLPPPKQPQPSPLLDNYEGITLGPPLPDGRATLIVVSDDNGHPDQFARVLVLAFSQT